MGHECPTADYPGPVIPIGNLDGRRVALYRTQEGVTFVPVDPEALFVEHAADLRLTLRSYDVKRDVLFAFTESDVTWYAIDDERAFFESLLRNSPGAGRAVEDPFFRLSLAAATGYPDVVFRELLFSAKAISGRCPGFLVAWYEQTVADLETKGLRRDNWPRDPSDLLDRAQTELPLSARRILAGFNAGRSAVTRAIAGLREVVSRTEGKGPAGKQIEMLPAPPESHSRVLITGTRSSSVRRILTGLLRDGSPADACWDESLIPETVNDHAVWITFGSEPAGVQTSPQVGIPVSEIRIPSPLCALGFRFINVDPSFPLDTSPWDHPAIGSVDLLVYVVDANASRNVPGLPAVFGDDPRAILVLTEGAALGERYPADARLLRVGNASGAERAIAETQYQPAGYFGRMITGLGELEQSLARRALETLHLPKVVWYATAALHVGSEHLRLLQTLLRDLRTEHKDCEARVALMRREQQEAELQLNEQLRALRAELEPPCRADFQLLVTRCKEIAVVVVRDWIRLPGNIVPALFWFQRTALMLRIDSLLRDVQRRISSAIAEFWASSLTDSIRHPHSTARMQILAERFAIVSEPRFQNPLFQGHEGISPDLRPRAGDFAHWAPPVVGASLGFARDSFREWLRAYVDSLGYWATTQIALRDRLLRGGDGTSGLLDSIEAWASAAEAHVAGELARGLEEFGRQKSQEMSTQAELVLRRYERGSLEAQGRIVELPSAIDECERCMQELRRSLADLPGQSLD